MKFTINKEALNRMSNVDDPLHHDYWKQQQNKQSQKTVQT